MQTLNMPAYDFRMRGGPDGKQQIYDALRQRYVRLTPEEWVRQHFAQYLIQDRGVPRGLIAIEQGFTYQGMPRRADVVAHDRQGRPRLMAECKAPDVAVSQAAFDQVARYNKVVQAALLVVTNGLEHYCCRIDHAAGTTHFLDRLPRYDKW